jgi:hypothetical protein
VPTRKPTGLPVGRPRGVERAIRDLLGGAGCPEGIDRLKRIAFGEPLDDIIDQTGATYIEKFEPELRYRALIWLVERAEGKAKATVDVTSPLGRASWDLAQLSPDEVEMLIAMRSRALPPGDPDDR